MSESTIAANPPREVPIYTETLEFVERRPEYEGVATYIFHPRQPVPYVAGQYAHMRLLHMPPEIRRVREFSFASAPEDPDIWFGIDERSGSDYQKALRSLKVGDTVELFKIKSHLTWPPPASHIVMIAGGVGVTPFRAMLRDIQQKNLTVTTTLIHAAHDAYLYGHEMKELAGEYVPVTREDLMATLSRVANNHHDAHYYIAGSAPFADVVTTELGTKGIARVESDVFKGLMTE